MYYRMKVAGLERDLPICPVTDTLYIAGFVIFGDQELTVACARELLKRAPEYDYIVGDVVLGIDFSPNPNDEPDIYALHSDVAADLVRKLRAIVS